MDRTIIGLRIEVANTVSLRQSMMQPERLREQSLHRMRESCVSITEIDTERNKNPHLEQQFKVRVFGGKVEFGNRPQMSPHAFTEMNKLATIEILEESVQ